MKRIKIFLNTLSSIRKKHKFRVISFALFSLLLTVFPYPNIYFQKIPRIKLNTQNEVYPLPSPPLYPINKNNSNPPEISAWGVYIFDLPSDVSLFQKNINDRLMPASTTKIATALVALDYYKLEDILTVKTIIDNGRAMGLRPNEKISAEALLYGMLVHSANDAAFTLAENYPGGVEGFVSIMNKKAEDYHLENTHFTTPIGFDDAGNYTTAQDLGKLAKIALESKIFAKIVATKSITVSDVSYNYFHSLTNVNELLGRVSGVSGVKTGFTQNAGEILVTQVKKNDKNLIFVVLKSKDRFGDTQKLIDWVFENFSWEEVDKITPATQR